MHGNEQLQQDEIRELSLEDIWTFSSPHVTTHRNHEPNVETPPHSNKVTFACTTRSGKQYGKYQMDEKILADKDAELVERRRASNRDAARRSRNRKMIELETLRAYTYQLERENKQLKDENELLHMRIKNLEDYFASDANNYVL